MNVMYRALNVFYSQVKIGGAAQQTLHKSAPECDTCLIGECKKASKFNIEH